MQKIPSLSFRKILLSVGVIVLSLIILAWHKPGPNTNNSSQMVTKYPTDAASSLWAVVNKGRQLPGNYAPSPLVTPSVPLNQDSGPAGTQLRGDAAGAVQGLVGAARQNGLDLILISGYRSYATQVQVYRMEVDATGQKHADSVSARPGHSEHQTGLAADLGASSGECALRACFGDMPEGKWLAANAYRYGFIIRYQKGATPRTGYAYEPWHLRYVGKQLAAEMQRTSVTLEEYFHLPAYPDYPGRILKLRG